MTLRGVDSHSEIAFTSRVAGGPQFTGRAVPHDFPEQLAACRTQD